MHVNTIQRKIKPDEISKQKSKTTNTQINDKNDPSRNYIQSFKHAVSVSVFKSCQYINKR